MIAAIMQPYFFPYIGYFQLMQAVDVFVFYDDAQFMKGGWINRNRILVNGKPAWLTLPVKRDSLTLPINQRLYLLDEGIDPIKRKLHATYARASAFAETFPFFSKLLDFDNPNVAAFNINLLKGLAHRLDIRCDFKVSSEIDKPAGLHGETKVIDLCQRLGVNHYINPIGGTHLYDPQHFAAAELKLSFLKTKTLPRQVNEGRPLHLSIIDDLIQKGFSASRNQLGQYEISDHDKSADDMYEHAT